MADYSDTIESYDINVGIHSKLNEYREIRNSSANSVNQTSDVTRSIP